MSPKALLLACFSLAIFSLPVTAQSSAAPARLVTESGLHQATFETPQGRVRVYLPDDVAAGSTISGTVAVEPAPSRDEGQARRNLDELRGYAVEVGGPGLLIPGVRIRAGQQVTVTASRVGLTSPCREVVLNPGPGQRITYQLSSDGGLSCGVLVQVGETTRPGLPLILRNSKDEEVSRLNIPLVLAPSAARPATVTPQDYQFPSTAQAGWPIEIHGPFDGDAATTGVRIGDRSVPVLAESPRRIILRDTDAPPGLTKVEVVEGGVTAAGGIRNIEIKLEADRLNLTRGEQTHLRVTVRGIAGLTEDTSIRLRNESPNVVNVEGGNEQILTVPANRTQTGEVQTYTRTLTGVTSGSFGITARLAPPTSYVRGGPALVQPTGIAQPPATQTTTASRMSDSTGGVKTEIVIRPSVLADVESAREVVKILDGARAVPLGPCDEWKRTCEELRLIAWEKDAAAAAAKAAADAAGASAAELERAAREAEEVARKAADAAKDPDEGRGRIVDRERGRIYTHRDFERMREAQRQLSRDYIAKKISEEEYNRRWEEVSSLDGFDRAQDEDQRQQAKARYEAEEAAKQAALARAAANASNATASAAQKTADEARQENA